jgi:hypothetical protein
MAVTVAAVIVFVAGLPMAGVHARIVCLGGVIGRESVFR